MSMKQIPGFKNRITVEIRGPELVRFMNICAYHRVAFHRAHRSGDGMICSVSLGDFGQMYRYRHKAQVRISVRKKSGMYFWLRRNRTRKAAYFWAVLAFACLYVMSLFIWDISFEGNVRYTDSYLLRFVKEQGYTPGMRISEVSCSDLEKAIRNQYGDITWVSAMIDGTRLVIKVKENTDSGQAEANSAPCDLYASRSGIITRMVTREGIPQAGIGDEVEKGMLLVTGKVPVMNDSGEADHYLYKAASADIWIRYDSWFEYRVSRRQKTRVYGKTTARQGILLFGKQFYLPFSFPMSLSKLVPGAEPTDGKTGEERYTEQEPLCLFDNFYLPISSQRLTCREYTEELVACSDDVLTEQVNSHFLEYLENLEKIGVEIIENNVTIDMNEDFCLMKGTLVLEQNAAVPVPIEQEESPSLDNEM